MTTNAENAIINNAAQLINKADTASEYDRGVLELALMLLGLTYDDIDILRDHLLTHMALNAMLYKRNTN